MYRIDVDNQDVRFVVQLILAQARIDADDQGGIDEAWIDVNNIHVVLGNGTEVTLVLATEQTGG